MDRLYDYICDELNELEEKAGRDHKLSMSELQYGDLLAHFKKSLLTAEAMEDADEGYGRRGYSRDGGYDRDGMNTGTGGSYMRRGGGYSYRRNARRDSMGRYSRMYSGDGEEMAEQLRSMMEDAPNDQVKQDIQKLINKVENM